MLLFIILLYSYYNLILIDVILLITENLPDIVLLCMNYTSIIIIFILLSILVYFVFTTDTNPTILDDPNRCWIELDNGEIVRCFTEPLNLV